MSAEMRKKQLEEALSEARDIARKKDLNDEERADLLARVEQIEELRTKAAEDARVESALKESGSTDPTSEGYERVLTDHGRQLGIGASFVRSEQYAAWRAKGFDSRLDAFEYRQKSNDEYRTKAEPTVVDLGTALSGLVVPERVGTIEGLPSHPFLVANEIPKIPTGSNAVSYFVEESETGGVDPVLEGAEKANFTLAGALVTDEVEPVAGMAAVTRQTLEDAAFMAGFIDTRLTRALEFEKEFQILAGNGASPNLDGFLNRTTGERAVGGDTVIDAIYKAADDCYNDGGYMANAVVMTPSAWQPIALAKDDNNRYYGNGPFENILGPTIWGMKVLKTRVGAMGTRALVGAFDAAAFIAVRDGVTIRTSDSHSDYFKKNKIAVLIEQRLALGVPQPLAFCVLSGVASS